MTQNKYHNEVKEAAHNAVKSVKIVRLAQLIVHKDYQDTICNYKNNSP